MFTRYINFDAIHQAQLQSTPYPYLIIPQLLHPAHIPAIIRDFPLINSLGSFPSSELSCAGEFKNLLIELESPDLRDIIAQKFAMDLQQSPTMITVRGKTGGRDGKIHTDSKDKRITVLLYMNQDWESQDGKLRLLHNNKNLEDYFAEIPPTAGSCVIFKVTDNCWHGHKPFFGVRKAIQLNYVTDQNALNKHLNKHRFSAKFKAIKHWFKRSSSM